MLPYLQVVAALLPEIQGVQGQAAAVSALSAPPNCLHLGGEAEACWVDLWAAKVLVLPRREKPLLALPLERAPRGSAAGPRQAASAVLVLLRRDMPLLVSPLGKALKAPAAAVGDCGRDPFLRLASAAAAGAAVLRLMAAPIPKASAGHAAL